MWIGEVLVSPEAALLAHAIAAPIIFAMIAYLYFKRFAYTTPLQTAMAFLIFVLLVDFFFVALFLDGNLAMFRSMFGVWVPVTLIFLTTFLTGQFVKGREHHE